MRYVKVGPEAPYGLGENTSFNEDPNSWRYGSKPYITIDLILLGLPIPDLTTSIGLYLVTESLAKELAQFTGLKQREFTLSLDEQMTELGEFDEKQIPKLTCFEVDGEIGETDFARVKGVPRLLVSERAMQTLQRFNLGHARIEPFDPSESTIK